VLYERHGTINPIDGPLEIEMSGRFVVLGVGPDGERLRVDEGRWEDPFEEPLSPENRAFVEETGKWRRFDCSQEAPYSDFVGRAITEARLLWNRAHKVVGVRISVDTRSIWIVVEFDECHIYWAQPFDVTEVAHRT
jgi:hypothetical protein